jgi:hypothetical protein
MMMMREGGTVVVPLMVIGGRCIPALHHCIIPSIPINPSDHHRTTHHPTNHPTTPPTTAKPKKNHPPTPLPTLSTDSNRTPENKNVKTYS